ncbi:MAG: hypothetical protein P4L99_01240 [Chthoniobacter sp.]|nr:hypothetical protein [Chthoniobacter sp.]
MALFHRVLVEDWQRALTIISFGIFALVFLLTLARAMRLRRDQVHHLENLPLENDSDEKPI